MSNKLTTVEVHSLLSKLCIDLGFCLPPDDIARLQLSPPDTVDSSTDAVFTAEGLDPLTSDQALRNQVMEVVATAFEGARTGTLH